MPQKHSRQTDRGRAVWLTERLWELARGLPVRRVPVAGFPELDRNCWFGPGDVPTCRSVAEHARKIFDADLGYPIILAADGSLMDGGHRRARRGSWANAEIDAVRFDRDPEPDYILPDAT